MKETKRQSLLIPAPRSVREHRGEFLLTAGTVIVVAEQEGWREAAEALRRALQPATGFALDLGAASDRERTPAILLDWEPAANGSAHPEGYRLEVSAARVRISAAHAPGLFYGVQTLLALLPPEIAGRQLAREVTWSIPALTVEDQPRFSWRGLMLDCSRHFFPVPALKRYLDIMAGLKLNRFHWHLTDDHGWRLQIRKHPRLTQVGGFIEEDEPWRGGFYSQEDVREVVAYAAARHILVIPEIDVPGHSYAAMKSYPWLCCTGDPVRNPGHQKDLYCAGSEKVFAFLEDIFAEVTELFPGPFVHVGGDEAPKDRWMACPRCQERMRQEGLAGEGELQSYFMRRLAKFLAGRGRRIIGWDEVLGGGALGDSVIHWWRYRTFQEKPAVEAARRGHPVIASPNSFCYLNFPPDPDEHFVVERTTDLAKVWEAEFVPAGLTPEEAGQILGGEYCLWTEFITHRNADRMLFPRLLAGAELLWRYPAREERSLDALMRRIEGNYPRLAAAGIEWGQAFKTHRATTSGKPVVD